MRVGGGALGVIVGRRGGGGREEGGGGHGRGAIVCWIAVAAATKRSLPAGTSGMGSARPRALPRRRALLLRGPVQHGRERRRRQHPDRPAGERRRARREDLRL